MRWVVNASPVILLAKIQQADLLLQIPDAVVIPQSVADEIRAAGPNDSGRHWLESPPIGVVQADRHLASEVASWDLGAGESAVVSWALDAGGCEVVIDDLAGRRCAEVMRIPVTGSLGVILIAKRRGLVEQAKPLIESLRRVGAHLSDSLVQSALNLVGE